MKKYQFRKYNSKYKKFFLKEKNTITKALRGHRHEDESVVSTFERMNGKYQQLYERPK